MSFVFTGESCQACNRMPGCVHGSCIKPFECRCEDGWTGMFCDKREFYETQMTIDHDLPETSTKLLCRQRPVRLVVILKMDTVKIRENASKKN
jgi:hypothetical protein